MSFREKHLWISIVATIGVWGWYYWRFVQAIAGGALESDDFARVMGGLFVGCLILTVVIEIVLTIVATLTTSRAEQEARDERETLAALKASHVSLTVLVLLVIMGASAAYFAAWAEPAFGTEPGLAVTSGNVLVLFANVLLGSVIVSELIRHGLTLALLRRL